MIQEIASSFISVGAFSVIISVICRSDMKEGLATSMFHTGWAATVIGVIAKLSI